MPGGKRIMTSLLWMQSRPQDRLLYKWTADEILLSIKTDPTSVIPIMLIRLIKLWFKKSWILNYRINLLLFLHKSCNLIYLLWIKWPYKTRFVDTIQKFRYNLSLSDKWMETKLFELVTGTSTKPWLSGNMLPNGWSNFSENMRVVAIKLFELTQFA